MVHEIFCSAPVGDGTITLHGDAGLPGMHQSIWLEGGKMFRRMPGAIGAPGQEKSSGGSYFDGNCTRKFFGEQKMRRSRVARNFQGTARLRIFGCGRRGRKWNSSPGAYRSC